MPDMMDELTTEPEPFREDQIAEPPAYHDPRTGEVASVALLAAIHKVVTELPVWITKDATAAVSNTRKQKYATLKTIMETVRPIALRHGIRIRQNCEHAWQLDTAAARGRMIPVYTELILSSTGERERTTVEIPLGNLDAQGMGSAISYGRRYCLLLAFGLTTDDAEHDDDDGEATKQRAAITKDHVDSIALMNLREEIDSLEDYKKLADWGQKLTGAKTDILSDTEMGMLRAYFSSSLKKLRDKPDEEAPAPKKK